MNKFERQGAILRLVRERPLSTQAEVAEALREQGFEVVQTTVSRDIAQLGLVKVRGANSNGKLVYAHPDATDLDRLSELTAAFRRWALSLTPTGNLVVIQTPAGFASPLAEAIDNAHNGDIAGTIAGENTIFVATRDGTTGAELVEQLHHYLGGDT